MLKLLSYKCPYLFLLLSWGCLAAPEGWRPLLEPAELDVLLQQATEIRVLQVTGSFARGHLPGAVESLYANWRGPIENPGALPDIAALTEMVQELGIEAATPVVVVHAGSTPADMGAATRVYWTLKSLGVVDVAVINGGLQAWRDQGLPLSTENTEVPPSEFIPSWNEQWRVTTAEVEELVQSGTARLIDSRPLAFFQGLQSSFGRPGTIRGASNLTYESWFDGDRLKTEEELRTIYAAHGPIESPITVNFCNTGHWSSINWFVMSELLQVSDTRLYAESMAEWSQRYRPMDNNPGRLSIYGKLTLDWLQSLINRDS